MVDPHNPENGIYADVMISELEDVVSRLRRGWDYKLITEESGFCDICPSDLSTAKLIPPNSLTGHLRRCRKCVDKRLDQKIILLALKRPGPGRKWLSAREFRKIISEGDYPLRDQWLARIFKRNPRTRNPGTESDIDDSEKDNEDEDNEDAPDNGDVTIPTNQGLTQEEEPMAPASVPTKKRHYDVVQAGDGGANPVPKQRKRMKKGAAKSSQGQASTTSDSERVVVCPGSRFDQIGQAKTPNMDQPLDSTLADYSHDYSTPPTTTGSSYTSHGLHGGSSSAGTPTSQGCTSSGPQVPHSSGQNSLKRQTSVSFYRDSAPSSENRQYSDISVPASTTAAPNLQSLHPANWNPNMYSGYQSHPLPPPVDMSTHPSFMARPSYPRAQSDVPVQKVDWSPNFQANMVQVQQKAREEAMAKFARTAQDQPRPVQQLSRSRTEPQLDIFGAGNSAQPMPPMPSSSLKPLGRQHSMVPANGPSYPHARQSPYPQARGFVNQLPPSFEADNEGMGVTSISPYLLSSANTPSPSGTPGQGPSSRAGPGNRPPSPREEFYASLANSSHLSQIFPNTDPSGAPQGYPSQSSGHGAHPSGPCIGPNPSYTPVTSDVAGFFKAQADRASVTGAAPSSGLGMKIGGNYRNWIDQQLGVVPSNEEQSAACGAEEDDQCTVSDGTPEHFTPAMGMPSSFASSAGPDMSMGFNWESFQQTGACSTDMALFPNAMPTYNTSQQVPWLNGASAGIAPSQTISRPGRGGQ
ncbi:hypothetical protein FRC03_008746 [Tulasnella sp. 419]|nr:hypothetical protein FRC03_008746 [Tulasnella sp. 419]